MHANQGGRQTRSGKNDVLITCKAVTLRGGQRIFASQCIFHKVNISEARGEPAEEIIQ